MAHREMGTADYGRSLAVSWVDGDVVPKLQVAGRPVLGLHISLLAPIVLGLCLQNLQRQSTQNRHRVHLGI